MSKKMILALTLALSSVSSFASDTDRMIKRSPIIKGVLKGIESEHKVKCGKVKNIFYYNDKVMQLSMFKVHVGCSAKELNQDGDRESALVEITGAVGESMIQVSNISIEWAG